MFEKNNMNISKSFHLINEKHIKLKNENIFSLNGSDSFTERK